MPGKKFDDPVLNGFAGIVALLMRRTDAEGRKAIYDELYTMHVASGKAGQPKTSQLFLELMQWAGIQRQQQDPH